MQVTRLYKSNRNRLLIVVAALLFVFTQTLDLQHTHDGDLNLQVDCQVCLKLGSQNDVAIAKSEDPQTTVAVVYFQSNVLNSVFETVRTYSPRAPPRSFS